MTRAVPLPGWAAALAMPAGTGRMDAAAPPGWNRGPGESLSWASRSAWTLAALAVAASTIKNRPCRIALPAYICNQSLWPLRQTGATLSFYPVDPGSLAPCWDRFEPEFGLDLVVVVHYFGWPAELSAARAFCDARDAALVEDCAHVLRPATPVGLSGEAALFSPHKLLAVPDGAILTLRGALAGWTEPVRQALDALGGDSPSFTGWRLRRLIQKTPLAAVVDRLRPPGQARFADDPETRPMAALPQISAAAQAMIEASDLDAIAARRRANAAAMAEILIDQAGIAPLFPVVNSPAPYRLPVLCDGPERAEQLFQACRALRFPAESWPDLPPETQDGAALALRRRVLLLPCHQDLTPTACRRALERILRPLSGGSGACR